MADHSEPLDIEPCSIEVMENHLLQLETELQEEDNNDDDIISEIEHVKSRIQYWKAARQSKSKSSKKGKEVVVERDSSIRMMQPLQIMKIQHQQNVQKLKKMLQQNVNHI